MKPGDCVALRGGRNRCRHGVRLVAPAGHLVVTECGQQWLTDRLEVVQDGPEPLCLRCVAACERRGGVAVLED